MGITCSPHDVTVPAGAALAGCNRNATAHAVANLLIPLVTISFFLWVIAGQGSASLLVAAPLWRNKEGKSDLTTRRTLPSAKAMFPLPAWRDLVQPKALLVPNRWSPWRTSAASTIRFPSPVR